ncbi:MAG: SDR family oxidoreductase [Spirochaetales bacterium]|nr:SDR family oxidoreductase [Spirochaetales bacterium]
MKTRPLALVTGASRKAGIGAAAALELSRKGWGIAVTTWTEYDRSMPWGSSNKDLKHLEEGVRKNGGRFYSLEADLSDPETPGRIFDWTAAEAGGVSALILSHCYSVDSSILTTSVESFDRHFQINTRASWLLIREFARCFDFQEQNIPGRIIALTSDHTVLNLPYGASKGALDRIVLAAAEELKDKRILANVINPGANDTGWMSGEFKELVKEKSFQGRIGTPEDTAHLIAFLCSKEGEWINGQLLCSNGGVRW